MFKIRKKEDRGITKTSWLDSRHSFSFGNYYDQNYSGFGPLRVINEDWVAPGQGFDMHGHRNMEILTYMISGTLAHRDSLNNSGQIESGDVQFMSAGKGILHSEYNPSATETAHLLQIWIVPDVSNTAPAYAQPSLRTQGSDHLRLIASPGGRRESFSIKSDAFIYTVSLAAGANVPVALDPRRRYWLQLAAGRVQAARHTLDAGDGLAIADEDGILALATDEGLHGLLFDLPHL